MEQVLALAALGEGTARPNPRVGCVVVRDGAVVGVGWHRSPGAPHAEVEALDAAGERARGATLYVNLEPCAHHGRTPPCVERVIAGGVARVVASMQDPNPLVDGRGFRALRGAGIRVDTGLLARDAAALNAAFVHWHRTGRPRVTVKIASSLDGRTAAAGGLSRWITGEAARRFAHRLRYGHDAILVGAGTVRADDPALDVRLPGLPVTPRPIRVVLAPEADLAAGARVFRDDGAAVRVYVRTGRAEAIAGTLGRSTTVVEVPFRRDAGLDLDAVLDDLGAAGAQSVLVEGGAITAGRFVAAGRADAFVRFEAPTLLGARGGRPVLDADAVPSPADAGRIRPARRLALGEDGVVIGEIVDRGRGPSCSPV